MEAALFLADEPLTTRKLAEVVGLKDGHEARRAILELRELYKSDGTAFQIEEIAGGFQLFTRPEFHPWLVRAQRRGADLNLTPSSLETLAIVAYKQPIMRAEVDTLRGVASAEILRVLLEKGLIRIRGRHDSLGRPQLYGTSKKFLQLFGLNSLAELPEVESLPKPII